MGAKSQRAGKPPKPGLKVDTERVLNDLAEEVRRLYCAHREFYRNEAAQGRKPFGAKYMPRWDGGEDAQGRVHQSTWHKVARFLVENRCEPLLFMEAQFAERTAADVLPPNLLYNRAALDRYEAMSRSTERGLKAQWGTQFDHFALKVFSRGELYGEPEEVAAFRVLADPQYDLSPLFRFCLAWKAGNAELVAQHRLPALEHQEGELMRRSRRETALDRKWHRSLRFFSAASVPNVLLLLGVVHSPTAG